MECFAIQLIKARRNLHWDRHWMEGCRGHGKETTSGDASVFPLPVRTAPGVDAFPAISFALHCVALLASRQLSHNIELLTWRMSSVCLPVYS